MDSVVRPFLPLDPGGRSRPSHCWGGPAGTVLWLSSGLSYWYWGVPDCRGARSCPLPRNSGRGTKTEFLPSSATSNFRYSLQGAPSQYIHSPGHLIHHKDIPSVGLLPLIGLYIYPRISLFGAHRCPPCTHF